ncbi:hypothetical protein SPFM9_00142 [Salmonella phage SPFM9]|nr:hypothetical protein SPFM9_00142 [Salmonella phage SPFM9]
MVIQTGIDLGIPNYAGPLNSNTVQDVPTLTVDASGLPQWAGLRKVLDDGKKCIDLLTYGIDFTAYKNLDTSVKSDVLNAIQEPISPSLTSPAYIGSATLRYNRGLPVLSLFGANTPNYTNTQTIAALSFSVLLDTYGVNFSAIDIQNYWGPSVQAQFVTFDAPNLHSAGFRDAITVYYDRVNLARLLPVNAASNNRNTSARLRGIQGSNLPIKASPANCYVEKVTQVPINYAKPSNELVFDLINRDNPVGTLYLQFNDLDDPSEV